MRLVQIEHGSLCCCGKLSELGKNPGEECVSYFGELCRSPSEVCFDFPLFFLLTWLDSVVLSLTSAEQSRRTTHRRKHWWIQEGKKNNDKDTNVAFQTWLGIQLQTWRTVPVASTLFVWTRSAAHLWMLPALSRRFCHTEPSLRAWGGSSCSSGPEPGLVWHILPEQRLMKPVAWDLMVELERIWGQMWRSTCGVLRISGRHHPGSLNVWGMKQPS